MTYSVSLKDTLFFPFIFISKRHLWIGSLGFVVETEVFVLFSLSFTLLHVWNILKERFSTGGGRFYSPGHRWLCLGTFLSHHGRSSWHLVGIARDAAEETTMTAPNNKELSRPKCQRRYWWEILYQRTSWL